MTTTPKGLPTYESGDMARFLTAGGWNAAMSAIDSAIGAGGDTIFQEYTFVGELAANETTATVTPATMPAGTVASMSVFAAGDIAVTDITASDTAYTVTVETAPTEAVSFNLTVRMAVVKNA